MMLTSLTRLERGLVEAWGHVFLLVSLEYIC